MPVNGHLFAFLSLHPYAACSNFKDIPYIWVPKYHFHAIISNYIIRHFFHALLCSLCSTHSSLFLCVIRSSTCLHSGGIDLYKVMIVDDEAIIREGLRSRIDWQSYGFELVGDYANGCEALDAVGLQPPDLIISDICMPFMDGLELAEHVQQQYPQIKMVILTGFDEFEYARRAIRLKVSDFILKPITAYEIRERLIQIRTEMDESYLQQENIDQIQLQLSQSLPLLRERFWEEALTTGVPASEYTHQLQQLQLPMMQSPYCMSLLESSSPSPIVTSESNTSDQPYAMLYSFIEQALPEQLVFVPIVFQSQLLVLFAAKPGYQVTPQSLRSEMQQLLHAACIRVEVRGEISFSGGIGHYCDNPILLPNAYRDALYAIDEKFLLPSRSAPLYVLSTLAPLPPPNSIQDTTRLYQLERELLQCIRNGDMQLITSQVQQLADQLYEQRFSRNECISQFDRIAQLIRDWLVQLDNGIDFYSDWQQVNIVLPLHLNQLTERMITVLKALHHRLYTASHSGNQHIQRALQYIEQHYGNPKLSLQDMCTLTLMSTTRFCQAFKQHTGETYIEYLTHLRIDKARELLRLTDDKFYQIAEKVGYTDPNYFSAFFKKHTGLTLRQYREQQRRVQEGVD